jgi:pimeloyl-ACP methyl ester carboxylesterase
MAATFVLVYGATGGGWHWKTVAGMLRAAGRDVYTPTLTGLGERTHLASPAVDLQMHIQDIVAVLRYEDLHNVILVGHSYAGLVITGVAEQEPERLAHLVYLDALVLQNGETFMDIARLANPEVPTRIEEMVRAQGDGWWLPITYNDYYKYDWRDTPQPLKTMTQPLQITNPAAAALPHTFIHCTDKGPVQTFDAMAVSATRAREASWRYRELPTTHMAMWTMPRELTDLLLEFVSCSIFSEKEKSPGI